MLRTFALTLLLIVVAGAAGAQTPAADAVPPALRDWRPWALKDVEYRACPFLASSGAAGRDDYLCAWPGRLNLASSASGATFALHWRVEAPGWIALPGDSEHWPQQVTVNAQHVPVLPRANASGEEGPALWLTAGSYEIAGRIPWREQPQSLALPSSIGLISLSVDGKPVLPVQRDGNAITLGRVTAAAPEADNLELRVYRKLTDGVPAQLSTRLMLVVSGQAREEVIGPVLPPGFAPLALTSAWPARLDADGRLHVQVQPGGETLALEARALAPLTTAVAKLPPAPWPKQEVWSYEAASRLRVTAASGAVQLDPHQAEVPGEWQLLPAFALGDAAKLQIEERSRGLAADEANRLSLQREAWLDFDGSGWFARDRVSGSMAQGWRFDMAAPFTLEQAAAQNSTRGSGGEPLLITRGAKDELSGVEWRTPNVDLAAGVRIASAAAMPVAGWQQTFDRVQATLHFPYGYKLLGAPGADSADGSWISSWTLLDIFICAIVTLLAWRLLGFVGAIALAGYLLLGYKESGSPLWTLLFALAFALIVRALPAGRLVRVAEGLRRAALLLLVLAALPFVAEQVRYALYPQLESGSAYTADTGLAASFGGVYKHRFRRIAPQDQNAPVLQAELRDEERSAASATSAMREAPMATAPPPPAPMAPPPPMPMEAAKSLPRSKVYVDKAETHRLGIETKNPVLNSDRASQIEHYSETTVVQTGRGAPSWNLGSSATLSWSGPVLATQSVHLLVAPPWLVRPLRLVLALLLAWLIWQLVRAAAPVLPRRGLAAAAIVFAGMTLSGGAQAQAYPSEELLKQLRERLTEVPKCVSACASLAEAQIGATGDALHVTLEAHAAERVALPLPGDAASAMLKSVQVDGVAEEALVRDTAGVNWIAVTRGVHRIELEFAASADKIALAFPLKPARVLFQGKGWDAAGLSDEHLLTETLTLARAHDSASSVPDAGVQQFPAYVRVVRNVSLGLEWSAETQVARLSPVQGGFAVDVPLLTGEHVSSAGIKVQNGKVPVAIADGEQQMSWQSTLDKVKTLTLTAPALAEHAEVWHVLVSPTWHVEFSGVPGVGLAPGENPNDYRNFEFHPLPGETLALRITQPLPAQGASRAIDAVAVLSEAGQHAATHSLSFTLRASQGGDQIVTLPKDAEVLAVSRDGQVLNLRALDGRLTLPVMPGTHRYEVRFRDHDGIGVLVRTPSVGLGQPAANVALTLQLPSDRWLLAASGPPVGPAVLYWGELIVMLALAFALARTRRTRLRLRDWLLLGLGFSTFSWIALLIVVAWLFAFDWRARATAPALPWQFNLLQVALALLTLVALLALASAIPQGLLGQPDMHVTGNGSYPQALNWFADHSSDALPQASAVSLPLWVYKVLMLAWALWLANALIGWLRDGFAAWTKGGYWQPPVKPAPAADAGVPLPQPETP